LPAFPYYATVEDSLVILRELCDRGWRIIPDPGAVAEPQARAFAAVTDELVAILRAAPRVYLAGEYTRFPIRFNRTEAGTYVIDPLAQGPVLQMVVGRLETVEGTPTLLPAAIAHHARYRHPTLDQLEPASKELLGAYTLASLTIRNRSTRAAAETFVMPGALALLRSRAAVLG
jgi:hypothetical protein